ncbi:helix-turn-helix domain-containing protein [Streptomyces sp. NPDC017988]|uniref:helix-turn-helix domain-containing protein n=1 Tax=Streptomyces sp. NPDC017988 TaxID=3365025 RepID=UPI0037903871
MPVMHVLQTQRGSIFTNTVWETGIGRVSTQGCELVDDFYERFGESVRRARTALGMSQQTLGSAVGLNRTSISNIEQGRQRVALHMLYELASALKVEPERLLPGSTERTDVLDELPEDARLWAQNVLANAEETERA